MCENLGGPERLPHTDLKPRSSSWMDGAGALEQRSRVPRQGSCGVEVLSAPPQMRTSQPLILFFFPKAFLILKNWNLSSRIKKNKNT